MDTYQRLFEKAKYDPNIKYRSRSWFEQQVGLLGKQISSPQKLLKDSQSHARAMIVPGNLYLFQYDAKHKKTLPYFDRFPLVFPFKKVEGGFLGLNMHYLNYPLRIKLLDRLQQYRTTDNMDEKTKIKLSWALIDGTSRLNLAIPCVKHYLVQHVRSQFIKIDAKDWATAMLLPVERFQSTQGTTKQEVWKDSLGKL